MQEVFSKAYKGFLNVVDNFANGSAGEPTPSTLAQPAPKLEKPTYAYPCDNYIDTILENKLTRQTLRTIVNKYYGKQLDDITSKDTKLTPTNFPTLWTNYQHCCTTLDIMNVPKVFVTAKLKGINALSAEIENESVILLSYPSAIMLNDTEQRFLLGHELGHIQLGHLLAHIVQGLLADLNKRVELLGPIVNDIVDVPLNRWYRTSEFTADRAGYLCCEDMQGIKSLFSRLGSESPMTVFAQYKELSDAYPRIATRLEVLQEFVVLRKNSLCQ